MHHDQQGSRFAVEGSSAVTCKISANNGFALEDLALPDEHRPSFELVGVLLDDGWHLGDVCGDEMVRHDILEAVEPELRELGEQLTFVRNALVSIH